MIHVNPEAFVRTSTSRPSDWNLLRVKPNMERRVCETLRDNGLNVYVPIERYRPATHWKARTRPLIPGYIFAELPDDEALDLARANHAVRDVLCNYGEPVVVHAIDVGALILGEAFGAFDFTNRKTGGPKRNGKRGHKSSKAETRWKSGQRVKVIEGPFASFPGWIERVDRGDRITVMVSIFGRVTPVDLDEDDVEPHPDQEAAA